MKKEDITDIYVVGLQGVGKSRFAKEHYPTRTVLDIEDLWEQAPSEFDFYEKATWTKVQMGMLVQAHWELNIPIVVEITGMTKASQAAIAAIIAAMKPRKAEVVYLRPLDWNSYIESISRDDEAQEMFRAYSLRKRGSWREPIDCPYLKDIVRLIEVDHGSWEWKGRASRVTKTEDTEVWEVKYE